MSAKNYPTLLEAIHSSGLSITKIEKLSGLRQGNLSRWLNGKVGISLKTAEKVAEALGLSMRAVKVR